MLYAVDHMENSPDDDWEEWFDMDFPVGGSEGDVYNYIDEFANDHGMEPEYESIQDCIISDYPAGAKKIVKIFKDHIVPMLKEDLI